MTNHHHQRDLYSDVASFLVPVAQTACGVNLYSLYVSYSLLPVCLLSSYEQLHVCKWRKHTGSGNDCESCGKERARAFAKSHGDPEMPAVGGGLNGPLDNFRRAYDYWLPHVPGSRSALDHYSNHGTTRQLSAELQVSTSLGT